MLLCYLAVLMTAVAVTFGLPPHRHNHHSRDVPHPETPEAEDNRGMDQDFKSLNKQTSQSDNGGQTTDVQNKVWLSFLMIRARMPFIYKCMYGRQPNCKAEFYLLFSPL